MSAVEEVNRCLSAYRLWEPHIRAFAWMDAQAAIDAAAALDRTGQTRSLPLAGMPIGVKDIFDTAGIPTEYGSPIFRGRVPASSADAVTHLESAGAVIFGKTVTAELAHYSPGPTTNPWNEQRTPGGSSMGSAAAVAARVVPAAIGSQTNGSIIRPAAFCGVVGFKPTASLLPTGGVLRVSSTLDQLGAIAIDVATASSVAALMAGAKVPQWLTGSLPTKPRLAVIESAEWDAAETSAVAHFKSVADAARDAGASLTRVEMPSSLADAVLVHRTIVAVEAHRNVAPLVEGKRQLCTAQLLSLLDEGEGTSASDYSSALARRLEMIDMFDKWIEQFDAVIAMPTLGEAPPIATTGDPRFCTRWTLLGAPSITVPTGFGPNGLPLGTQLVGRRHGDRDLVAVARWLEAVMPAPARPPQVGADSGARRRIDS